jgi:hypothetical protein
MVALGRKIAEHVTFILQTNKRNACVVICW